MADVTNSQPETADAPPATNNNTLSTASAQASESETPANTEGGTNTTTVPSNTVAGEIGDLVQPRTQGVVRPHAIMGLSLIHI